ncbi:MAG: hypothetical protein GEV12_00030 [Micromonosporaceae bacterium]|nr:hypothetical protein [Micromonosporaceae bacterium]
MCQVDAGYVLVHNPTGVVRPVVQRPHEWPDPPAVALEHGLVIVDNLIPGMTELAASVQARWQAELGGPVRVVQVPHSRPTGAGLSAGLAGSGLALLGLGNCGACTTWLAELAADLVPRMPVAVLVTDRFAAVARARLRALGEPDLPVVTVPDAAPDTPPKRLAPVAGQVVAGCGTAWRLPGRPDGAGGPGPAAGGAA